MYDDSIQRKNKSIKKYKSQYTHTRPLCTTVKNKKKNQEWIVTFAAIDTYEDNDRASRMYVQREPLAQKYGRTICSART